MMELGPFGDYSDSHPCRATIGVEEWFGSHGISINTSWTCSMSPPIYNVFIE